MNIAQQGNEITSIANRLAAETIVEQRPQMAMSLVVVTDIRDTDAFHHRTDIHRAFGYKQMDMVIHQAIGVDVAIGRQWFAITVRGSNNGSQHLEEFASVLVVHKDVATVDTA